MMFLDRVLLDYASLFALRLVARYESNSRSYVMVEVILTFEMNRNS